MYLVPLLFLVVDGGLLGLLLYVFFRVGPLVWWLPLLLVFKYYSTRSTI